MFVRGERGWGEPGVGRHKPIVPVFAERVEWRQREKRTDPERESARDGDRETGRRRQRGRGKRSSEARIGGFGKVGRIRRLGLDMHTLRC